MCSNLFLLKQWTGCRFNLKPSPNSEHRIQINCYPQFYDKPTPYFVRDIDYENICYRKVNSPTKSNAIGMLWDVEEKKCCIVIAIDDEDCYEKFSEYLGRLLKSFALHNNYKNGKKEIVLKKL